ncbi:hypothetical protein MLD38_031831 [Melastoma candidum]|uniref:Uncharacterized protein n=1 Tax=Melastoma candidum TaxID=119954 RepID=A0ACB9MVI9_9MYRT|nr:hypothetical protein MLD38_031831 [Melastoma candidum]
MTTGSSPRKNWENSNKYNTHQPFARSEYTNSFASPNIINFRLLLQVGARPDALLPITHGPVNRTCNKWFVGAQDLDGCRLIS